jgi:hypothetical protein
MNISIIDENALFFSLAGLLFFVFNVLLIFSNKFS